ncbi:MAG: hypothetical protein IKE24_06845 [Clostridia bacterium]|nr:hypothetical protein [Clostridia bacterium]
MPFANIVVSECNRLSVEMSRLVKESVDKAVGNLFSHSESAEKSVAEEENTADIYEDRLGSYLVRLTFLLNGLSAYWRISSFPTFMVSRTDLSSRCVISENGSIGVVHMGGAFFFPSGGDSHDLRLSGHHPDERPHERRIPGAEAWRECHQLDGKGDEGGCQAKSAIFVFF